jgi:hypothetical protein
MITTTNLSGEAGQAPFSFVVGGQAAVGSAESASNFSVMA